MSRWCRLWSDMPNDPKWRVVAKRSGRPVSEVLAVFVHMMTNAANASERGSLEGWTDEDVAIAIDAETEHVEAIRRAMEGKTLDDNRLTGWEKRQPAREDGSAERAKAWREEKKAKQNADPLRSNTCEHIRTHPNAVERTKTPRGESESESDIEDSPSPPSEVRAPMPKVGRGSRLSADWFPNDQHFAKAASWGLPRAWVLEIAEMMREWAGANSNRAVARKADWDLTFHGFLRREAPKARQALGKQRQLPLTSGGNDPIIDFGGGYTAPVSSIVTLIRKGQWVPHWGPRYDQPDCLVPRPIIETALRSTH